MEVTVPKSLFTGESLDNQHLMWATRATHNFSIWEAIKIGGFHITASVILYVESHLYSLSSIYLNHDIILS